MSSFGTSACLVESRTTKGLEVFIGSHGFFHSYRLIVFLARFCLSLLISAALWPSSLNAQGIMFRSTEFGFRFVYPANWIEKTPRGPNVRALVDAPDGASNCNIVVRRMRELAGLSQKQIDAEAFAAPMSEADWKELLGSKFPDVKIRERRLTKIDNQLAQFAINEMSYTTVGASIYAVQMQVVTMTPGLFWNFGCVSGGQNSQTADMTFQKMRPTFTEILSSFVFER